RRPILLPDTRTHTQYSTSSARDSAHYVVALCFRHGLRRHNLPRKERRPAWTGPMAYHGILLRPSLPSRSTAEDSAAYQLDLPVNLRTLHHKNRATHPNRPG